MGKIEELKKEFCTVVDQLSVSGHTGIINVRFKMSQGGVLEAHVDVGRKLIGGRARKMNDGGDNSKNYPSGDWL